MVLSANLRWEKNRMLPIQVALLLGYNENAYTD